MRYVMNVSLYASRPCIFVTCSLVFCTMSTLRLYLRDLRQNDLSLVSHEEFANVTVILPVSVAEGYSIFTLYCVVCCQEYV